MKDGTAADSIYRNAIDQIRAIKSRAHVPGKEAKGRGLDRGESQPTNLSAEDERLVHWQKCYGDLWKLKLAFGKKHSCTAKRHCSLGYARESYTDVDPTIG